MIRMRFERLSARYAGLRVAVVGDVCLDRYLEIDPAREETSLETGLPVHNVVRVRDQLGGAGNVVANLAALGIGHIDLVGYCGDDGEGYQMRRALSHLSGVCTDSFPCVPDRRTFTYCKPIVLEEQGPRERSRLDIKNDTPTPSWLSQRLAASVAKLGDCVDAIIALEQTDRAETGVLTHAVRAELGAVARRRPTMPILADSRRSLRDFPRLNFKMNGAELASLMGGKDVSNGRALRSVVAEWAQSQGRSTFVTLSGSGIVAADPDGASCHVPALPPRGRIDVVGAGDSVTANVAAALAAGGATAEACHIAMAAASHTIHQIGTTGVASVEDISALL